MDPDEQQSTNQDQQNENGAASQSPRVFDISSDSISPVSNDTVADESSDYRTQSSASVTKSTPTEDSEKRANIPRDEDMLDQRIGTFDPTPFAGPATDPNRQTPIRPANVKIGPDTSQDTKTQAPPSVTQNRQTNQVPVETVKPTLQDEVKKQLDTITGINRDTDKKQSAGPIDMPAPRPIVPPPDTRERVTIKPVRTYEGDIAEVMSHRRTSVASIVIAEDKKQREIAPAAQTKSVEPPSHAGRKLFMFIFALILLGGGSYGAYYLYTKSALAPATPVVAPPKVMPGIIPADTQRTITLNSQTMNTIRASVTRELAANQAPNTITELIFVTKDATGVATRIPATTIISKLDVNAPDILTRSLTPYWMLGIYADPEGEKSIFVVATSDFFQNTFAGMLQWEPVMADDLRPFIYPMTIEGIFNEAPTLPMPTNPALENLNTILPVSGEIATSSKIGTNTSSSTKTIATSTSSAASTTESVQPLRPYFTIRGTFEDRIVKNRDVRAFRTNDRKILFLYSFIDNTRLVITDKDATLVELLNRLEKQSFVR